MKIFIETLGCPKNEVDSDKMAGILCREGHEIIDDADAADILIVNTCCFIHDAKLESIDTIFDMATIKKECAENPDESGKKEKFLIVTGCMSQRYSQDLFDSMPEVDAFLGVNDYLRLPDVINKLTSQGKSEPSDESIQNYICEAENKECRNNKNRISMLTESPREYCEIEESFGFNKGISSYLRIAEGCNNVCSFCVIPFIRGEYRSRKMEAIIKEANELAQSGTKELVIIAQDTTAYGIDIYGKYKLADLLKELCKIDGIKWIRLMYCYEDSITDELIDVIAENEKICKYIDIPLQHINDRILSSMNRNSDSVSIKDTISRLRNRIEGIHIRTTFITGYPGETEAEFNELANFIEETEFERLGVFTFSPEEGTEAAELPDQIEKEIAERRRDEIMLIQKEISLKKNKEKIGKVFEVMIEESPYDDGVYYGRTQYDAREIDNDVIITSDRKLTPGMFIEVEISDGFDYDLTAKDLFKDK